MSTHRLAELLSSRGLSLGAEVLELGLAEDDVGVRERALVHVGLGDHEQDALALLHSHAEDARHLTQSNACVKWTYSRRRPTLR